LCVKSQTQEARHLMLKSCTLVPAVITIIPPTCQFFVRLTHLHSHTHTCDPIMALSISLSGKGNGLIGILKIWRHHVRDSKVETSTNIFISTCRN
jgi:hypothetical protein